MGLHGTPRGRGSRRGPARDSQRPVTVRVCGSDLGNISEFNRLAGRRLTHWPGVWGLRSMTAGTGGGKKERGWMGMEEKGR